MSFQNIIVTGANRGIGLEFVKQLLNRSEPPKNLIATTRNVSKNLNDLKTSHPNLHILTYDVTNYEVSDTFVKQVQTIVGDEGIDLLINNAGIFITGTLETTTPRDILNSVEVNTCAPLMLTKSLLPMLKVSATKRKTMVVNIGARIGSIGDKNFGKNYAYRISKAGLNMVSKTLSVDLKDDKIIVLSLNPGWVQTDMGGSNAQIDTTTSVNGLLKVIKNRDWKDSGLFINYNDNIIPY